MRQEAVAASHHVFEAGQVHRLDGTAVRARRHLRQLGQERPGRAGLGGQAPLGQRTHHGVDAGPVIQLQASEELGLQLEAVGQEGIEQIHVPPPIPGDPARHPPEGGGRAEHRPRPVGAPPREDAAGDEHEDEHQAEPQHPEAHRGNLDLPEPLEEGPKIIPKIMQGAIAGLAEASHDRRAGRHEDDPSRGGVLGAGRDASEVAEQVRGKAAVAAQLEHVVDEHGGIGDHHQPPGSHRASEHQGFVLAEGEDRLELEVADDLRVVRHQRLDAERERMGAPGSGDEQRLVAPKRRGAVRRRLPAIDVEGLEERVGGAEVVGHGDARACPEERAESLDGGLVDWTDHQDGGVRVQGADIQTVDHLDGELLLLRHHEELGEAVPLGVVR